MIWDLSFSPASVLIVVLHAVLANLDKNLLKTGYVTVGSTRVSSEDLGQPWQSLFSGMLICIKYRGPDKVVS